MAKRHFTRRRKRAEFVDHDVPKHVQLALLHAEETALAQWLAKAGMCLPPMALDEIELALLRHDERKLGSAFARYRQQLGLGPEAEGALFTTRDVAWRELVAAAARTSTKLIRCDQ